MQILLGGGEWLDFLNAKVIVNQVRLDWKKVWVCWCNLLGVGEYVRLQTVVEFYLRDGIDTVMLMWDKDVELLYFKVT